MKKYIFIVLSLCFYCLSNQNIYAEVYSVDGYQITDCNTCKTNNKFAMKARFLARQKGKGGTYVIFNDTIGIIKSIKITRTIYEEGLDTFVVYESKIIDTTIENEDSFNEYMINKQNDSFPKTIEIETDRPYKTVSFGEFNNSVNRALKKKFGPLYMYNVKIGSIIIAKTKDDLTIALVKFLYNASIIYDVVYILDAEGNLIEVDGSTNFNASPGTGDHEGSSVINVQTSVGMFRIIILPSGWVELIESKDED